MNEVTLQQIAAGGEIRRRNKLYRVKDNSIKCVSTYTLEKYIDQISKWMGFGS